MPLDARELGHEGTMDAVRALIARKFGVSPDAKSIPADQPLFEVGVGLSSIEGMELLLELEREFGVEIKNVDWWIEQSPTLANVAEYLGKLTEEGRRKK